MSNKTVTTSHKKTTRPAPRQPSEFGKNLLRARRLLSWTRPYLASLTKRLVPKGVHENTIYNIEKGASPGSMEVERVLKEVISPALKCDYPWEDDGKLLNKTSLADFIRTSDVANRIDHTIAVSRKLKVAPPDSFLEFILDRAPYVGLKTPSELAILLKQNEQIITTFGTLCYQNRIARMPLVPRGFCVAALQAVLVLQKKDFKTLLDFVAKYGLDPQTNPQERAKAIKRTYDQATRALSHK